jgi:Na+/H+ antiporter NhaD/arsenite permease-like protein
MVFSAFLVNDAICLVMAPLVIEVTRALRRNPVPYLLAVAMASNAGSTATFTGNPQNMIIGVTSHLPYAEFFARLAPAAAVALVLTIGLIGLLNPGEFSTSFASTVKEPRPRCHAWQLAKGLLVTLAVIASFFCRRSHCRGGADRRVHCCFCRAPSHREKSMPKLMEGCSPGFLLSSRALKKRF